MIFTERTIKMSNDVCEIDNPIVLYRGDYNVEIRFTIIECPYKYSAKNSTNIIEQVDASYGQLVIRVPNDGSPIFSDVVETKRGSVVFTLSAEMIDESIEVGDYTFQIRLFDANRESRATIPPVENGISIREPIAFEDVTTTNEVGEATIGYALTTTAMAEDTFDSQGNYNKTTWGTGDRITAAKLNKIEAGIDGVNKKVASGGTGGTVDLTGYAKITDLPTKTSQLTNDSGYITNIPDEYITETELNAKGYATTSQIPAVPTNVSAFTNDANYATENFVTETVNNASVSGGYTHPTTHPASMITGLSTVATTGDYNDLTNNPTIPTKTSELTNNSNYVTTAEMTEAINNASLGGATEPATPVTYEWEIGGITSAGALRETTNRIRVVDYITFSKKTTFQSNNLNYELRWYKYDTNQTFVEELGTWTTKVEFEASTDYVYRVAIRKTSDTDITTDVVSYFDIYTGTKISADTVVPFYNDYPALFTPYKFKLEAHRGYSDKYPENTLLAFEEAGKRSEYSGIETDVHRTSDGVFVLMHDETIDRTTNGTGKPSAYTYEQLQEFYIDGGNGWDTQYANQFKIPKLTEYLKICKKYGKIPYIQVDQVESSYLGELIELLDKEGWKGRCVLTSFTLSDLTSVRSITDEYIFEYMVSSSVSDFASVLNEISAYKNVVFRPSGTNFVSLSNVEDVIQRFRNANILVECYGLNVGDTATLTKMIELGIEGVTCNSYVGFSDILGVTNNETINTASDLTIADIAGNFTATNVEDALAELYELIMSLSNPGEITTYNITNNLTNCSTSNDAATIIAKKLYSATISADAGYTLGTVTVSMGGSDITDTAYSNELTYEWEMGGLGSDGSFNDTAQNRIRTTEYKTITSTTTFTANNNHQLWWYRFNASDYSFVDSAGGWATTYTLEPNDSYVYYIAIRKSDSSTISVSAASNVTITTADGYVNIPSVTGDVVVTANANASA